jgi:UDP-N-acetylglucosamine--N-acetylmuramyl-(pentapeptide) pyrophosphoryl-undecaprenol N-acetylglucosamine transferase
LFSAIPILGIGKVTEVERFFDENRIPGTEKGIEARILAGGKFPLRMIQARPIKGRSFLGKLKALWSLPKAVSEASSILKEFQPQVVLGVGGYASGPTVLAASFLGMKRAIHEQNVVPGMTNRVLRWFSQRVFVSFEETKKYFPPEKTIVTGMPIRREILTCLQGDRQRIEKRKGEGLLFAFSE